MGNLECPATNILTGRECSIHSSKCTCTYCVQHSNNYM